MIRCRRLKEFFWWIRVVLTFGDVVDDQSAVSVVGVDQRTAENTRYNGKIASVQLFLVMIAISSSLSVWRLMTETYGATKTISLLVFMLIGLAVLIYFNIHRSKVLAPAPRNDHRYPRDYEPHPRDNFTVFGITVFYFFGCVMDIFHVFLASACFDVWRTCQSRYYTFTDVLHICFHVVRIVYLGAQTLFCIVFNRSTIADRSAVRCGLMCLAAINVGLWFESFVSVIFNLTLAQKPADGLRVRCYANSSNMTVKAVQCFQQNTTMHQFLNTYMSPIFIPFTIEIAILIGECVGHLFYHCYTGSTASSPRTSADRAVRRDYEYLPPNRVPPVANHPDEDSYTEPGDDDNYISLKHSEVSETSLLLSTSEDDNHLNPTVTRLSWHLSFLLAFLTNALYLALAILYRFHSETNIYLYYEFPFRALMVAATISGFQISRTFQVFRGMPFTAIDYILLVSYMGHLQLSLLAFLARLHRRLAFFAAQNVLDIIQGYFQATFVLYTRRLVPRRSAEESSRASSLFKYLVFFLAVSNGTLWLVETCIGLNLNLDQSSYFSGSVEASYYRPLTWSIMYNTLAPLDLMFHLLSCFALARTFLNHRR